MSAFLGPTRELKRFYATSSRITYHCDVLSIVDEWIQRVETFEKKFEKKGKRVRIRPLRGGNFFPRKLSLP